MQNFLEVYKRPVQQFCERNEIYLCILFGSRAIGQAREKSDVDIAILPKNPKVAKLRLIGELADIFPGEIDLVIIRSDTDPVLLKEIFEKGVLLYEQ